MEIIDTGSLPPSTFSDNGVMMHHDMYNLNFYKPRYTSYSDNRNLHGTAVVEIIKNGLFDKAEIFVARVSRDNEQTINDPKLKQTINATKPKQTINATKLILAMQEFQRLEIHIVNFSLSGNWKNNRLFRALESLQASGATVVASAGNLMPDASTSHIITDFNNGTTLMVGSYSINSEISAFSRGQCKANICALGENIFVRNALRSYKTGNSYTVPQVTAVCANYITFVSSEECKIELIKETLAETADNIACVCPLHNGQNVKLKMNPVNLMLRINTSKRLKLGQDVVVSKDKGANVSQPTVDFLRYKIFYLNITI